MLDGRFGAGKTCPLVKTAVVLGGMYCWLCASWLLIEHLSQFLPAIDVSQLVGFVQPCLRQPLFFGIQGGAIARYHVAHK